MNFSNYIAITYATFFLLTVVFRLVLDLVNVNHRRKYGDTIPEEVSDLVEADTLTKMNSYSNAKLLFSLVKYGITSAGFIAVLLTGVLPLFQNLLNQLTESWYLQALLFFASLYLVQLLSGIPFDLFFNFRIERKYQFNTMTFSTWITDLVKEILLSIILGFILLSGLLLFLYLLPTVWWVCVWLLFFTFSLLMQVIYPALIAPMFNKFKPLEDPHLQEKIDTMLDKAGFPCGGVFEMDASKRSTHSNAYFTGLGKTKRIVLFDSLLSEQSHEEILAVLAHEIGHFKLKHVLKNLIVSAFASLFGLFIASLLIRFDPLYSAFMFNSVVPYAGLLLITFLGGPLGFFLSPVGSVISRRHEYQADDFAVKLTGKPKDMISALKKLSVSNLSNLYPAPFYAWFYYSHPPLFKRIRALREKNN